MLNIVFVYCILESYDRNYNFGALEEDCLDDEKYDLPPADTFKDINASTALLPLYPIIYRKVIKIHVLATNINSKHTVHSRYLPLYCVIKTFPRITKLVLTDQLWCLIL